MPTRKKPSFEDVTDELNYSKAIRDQIKYNRNYDSNWDELRKKDLSK